MKTTSYEKIIETFAYLVYHYEDKFILENGKICEEKIVEILEPTVNYYELPFETVLNDVYQKYLAIKK